MIKTYLHSQQQDKNIIGAIRVSKHVIVCYMYKEEQHLTMYQNLLKCSKMYLTVNERNITSLFTNNIVCHMSIK